MKTIRFEDHLDKALKEPTAATAYLNEVAKDGNLEVLLMALHDVARAHGMTQVAKHSGLKREGIYKMLSRDGNPEIQSVMRLLESWGIALAFRIKPVRVKAKAVARHQRMAA